MAALMACGDWRKGADYTTPWSGDGTDRLNQELEYRWAKIIDTIERINDRERLLTRLLPNTDFHFYIFSYLEMYWNIEKTPHLV
jgi:hypothetical protein